jgi:peptidyl-prolyl cis-trans isomerase C
MAGMLPYDFMHPRRRVCLPLALLALILSPACKRAAPAALTPGAATGPIDRSRPLPDPLPAVAARVNGEPIPTGKIAALVRQREDRGNAKDGPNAPVLREALQQLIVRELLFQEALRRGLSADSRQLDRTYDELRSTEPDAERWRQRLVREGMTPDGVKQELRVQATVARLVASLVRRQADQIQDDEARAYFDGHPDVARLPRRWRASQILLKVPPDATPEDRKALVSRAEVLHARLKAGASFEALVREVSDDPAARESGGAMSELSQGSLNLDFEQALAPLHAGEISQVVTSSLGVHILKIHAVLAPEELPYEAVAGTIRETIVNAEQKRAVDELVRALESQARIEVFL